MSKIENEKLNKWYKQIKDYEYLKINEAKELYKLYLETKNINYLNRIIEGTLYITYNYINRNHLIYLSSSLCVVRVLSAIRLAFSVWDGHALYLDA